MSPDLPPTESGRSMSSRWKMARDPYHRPRLTGLSLNVSSWDVVKSQGTNCASERRSGALDHDSTEGHSAVQMCEYINGYVCEEAGRGQRAGVDSDSPQ